MTMAWQNGRQLSSLQTGDNTVTYKYDSNGLRTQKNNGSKTTAYYYDSDNNLIAMNVEGYVLYFYYDSNGNVTSFSHNDNIYYYVKNIQGDVVKIVNQYGQTVVTYIYDAWGNILNQDDLPKYAISNLNPFRYRGYIYDYETGLYYLQSRYYDPTTGRFLNADDTTFLSSKFLLGESLFTYCVNNPISYIDKTGNLFIANTSFHFIVAVGAYVAYKEFQMTIEMYLLSFFNDEYEKEYDFSNNTSYINKIKNTNAYKKLIRYASGTA